MIHKKDLLRTSDSSESRPGPPDLKVHDSIADTLRLARQEHGQDLRTVAQVLRIRHAYLEAIEKGDFEQLPGTAYAIGFLRTYAEFLGLDGELIVERYKHEVQGVEPKLDLVFPEPVGPNRIPGGAIVLISMVLLGLAYGGWFYLSNEGKSIADLMPPLPESLQAMISGDDGGQAAVTPEFEPEPETETPTSAIDGTQSAAVVAAEAPAYIPPESAEAESQAPSELAAPDVTAPEGAPEGVPAADFEAAPVVAQDAVAAPEVAAVFDDPAPEIVEATETPVPEIVETTEVQASENYAAIAETPAPPAPPRPPLRPPLRVLRRPRPSNRRIRLRPAIPF